MVKDDLEEYVKEALNPKTNLVQREIIYKTLLFINEKMILSKLDSLFLILLTLFSITSGLLLNTLEKGVILVLILAVIILLSFLEGYILGAIIKDDFEHRLKGWYYFIYLSMVTITIYINYFLTQQGKLWEAFIALTISLVLIYLLLFDSSNPFRFYL